MKIIGSLALILILVNCCFSQEVAKIEVYQFSVLNKIVVDTFTKHYYGQEYEFKYRRVIFKDSSFKESFLFSNDSVNALNTDTFKIKNGIWYLKSDGRWMKFYFNNLKLSSQIKINGDLFELKFIGRAFVHDIVAYKLSLKPKGFYYSRKTIYYFSPIFGVILIESDSEKLVRDKITIK